MSSIRTRIGASFAQHRRLSRHLVDAEPRQASGSDSSRYLNRLRNLSTFSLVTMVTGMSMLGLTFSPFLSFRIVSTPGDAFLERILLHDRDDPALVDALDRLGGEVPAEHLDLVGALAGSSTAEIAPIERRLAGGIERGHVGIGGHQVLGGRQRDVLDVLAVDRVEELDAAAGLRGRLEAVEPLVLDEGVERADDADLGRAAHLALHVVGEILADLLAGALVVDADEGGVVAVRDARIDRDDGNAGLLGGGDRRLDAVHVDRDEHDAVDLLGDVVLDRAVLRGRLIVGVEDDQLGARLVGGLLGAVVSNTS